MCSTTVLMEEHRIARWLHQQEKVWSPHDHNNSDDDGLQSSPDFHHPVHESLSPSPPVSLNGATSPSPSQQHSRTPSPRSRTLHRIHTVGSIILPPTSPLRSKIANHHAPLLSVRPAKHRSGSLSPVSPFLSPSDLPLQKTARHLSSSLTKIPSDDSDSIDLETDDKMSVLPDSDSSDELVSCKHLELLASQIGSKLSLVTNLLGLPSSDYEYALDNFKLPEFQALYVLKKWLDGEERRVGALCTVLDKAELSHIAKWCRNGILEEQLKKDQDRLKTKRQALMKKSFPGSFDGSRLAETDRSKLGALSETKLIKHNTINSQPAEQFRFLTEEK